MSAFVYFEPELRQKNSSFSLTPSENDHLVKVMRVSQGDEITLFDGKGYFATATVQMITKSTATLTLISPIEFQPKSSNLILCQALVRSSKLDWIIEKAVELGVAQFEFVKCVKSEVSNFSENQLERFQKIIIAAAKQSNNFHIPTITLTKPLLLWEKLNCPSYYGDPNSNKPLLEALDPTVTQRIFIGPESGFTHEEKYHLQKIGSCGALLTQNILRTETAAICAVALNAHKTLMQKS